MFVDRDEIVSNDVVGTTTFTQHGAEKGNLHFEHESFARIN